MAKASINTGCTITVIDKETQDVVAEVESMEWEVNFLVPRGHDDRITRTMNCYIVAEAPFSANPQKEFEINVIYRNDRGEVIKQVFQGVTFNRKRVFLSADI